MLSYLWVALGGALGSAGRYWCSGFVANRVGETFPFGTLAVNVIGSIAIGFLAGITGPGGRAVAGPAARQFFMIGVCGGYTTFSSVSLQTLNLAQEGEWLRAGANVLLSVVLCLAGVWAGHAMAMGLNSMRAD